MDQQQAVLQNILTRRSVRKYQQKPIPHDVLEKILEAGFLGAQRQQPPDLAFYRDDKQRHHRQMERGRKTMDGPLRQGITAKNWPRPGTACVFPCAMRPFGIL